jgi:protein TonB
VVGLSKLDLISLLLSLLLHTLILLVPSFRNAIFPKTYQLVNVVPISFDTCVESQLVGVKSVKGRAERGGSRKSSELPSGKRSLKRKVKPGGANSKDGKGREVKKRLSERKTGNLGSYKFKNLSSGIGKRKLSISVDVPGEKELKELPSISYNKLVPYLLKVRERIMRNWSLPYYRNTSVKERKVIVALEINRDGSIGEINIVKLSSDIAFNRSALSAIYSSEPFGKFPNGIKLDKVNVKVNFEVR